MNTMHVDKDMIDPQLRLPGAVLKRLMGSELTEHDLRKPSSLPIRLMARLPARGMREVEHRIPRPDGTSLRTVVFSPLHPTTNAAGVLWSHGGGYSRGSIASERGQIKALAALGSCVMVAPDYRLSAEAPYPAAVEDCYLALQWLVEHADDLGVNPDQIVAAGGSAGGGLTAALSLLARDRAEIALAFQMPLYPMIDDRPTSSSRDNDAPVYDGVTNAANWRLYLGDRYGTDDVPAYAAPARADDLAGLPPTITFVGGVDPFRDETVTYVNRLRAAGVPVEFREFPGAFHGFEGIVPWARVSKEAVAWRNDRWRDALRTRFAPQRSKVRDRPRP
jgi:acetyl esterase/lipase